MRISAFILFICSSSCASSILPNSNPKDMLMTSTCAKYMCKQVGIRQRKDFESNGQVITFQFSSSLVDIYYAKGKIKSNYYIDFVEINYTYSNSPIASNEICSVIKTFITKSQYINSQFCRFLMSRPEEYGSVQLFRFRLPNSNTTYAFNTINDPGSAKISINRISPR